MVLLANGREQPILGKRPQYGLFIIYGERPIILYGIVGERPRTTNTWQTTTVRIVYYLWRTANNSIWYCWRTAENNQYLANDHSMSCLLFMANGQYMILLANFFLLIIDFYYYKGNTLNDTPFAYIMFVPFARPFFAFNTDPSAFGTGLIVLCTNSIGTVASFNSRVSPNPSNLCSRSTVTWSWQIIFRLKLTFSTI